MNQPNQLPVGLAGFVAAQQQAQQQDQGQLQQAASLLGLQDVMRKQAQEQSFRSELAALGPNASQEQLAGVAAKYGSPADVLKTQQASLDRQATLAVQKATANARLAQQQQYAQMMHEWRLGQAKTADERAAEVARHNKVVEGLTAQNNAMNEELKRMGLQIQSDKVTAQTANQSQRQTQMLGTALERANLPESDATLRGVEDALKKNPNIAEYLSGPKSLLPDMAVPQDVREGRQAFQKLFNITLKTRSGTAVTNQELERLKQEFATGAFKTSQQLRAAVDQARNIIVQHYRAVASGFGSETLKAYNENMREMGGTPLLEPQSEPSARDVKVIDFGSLK